MTWKPTPEVKALHEYDMTYIYDKEGRIVDALFKRRVEKRGLLKRVLDLFRKSL